MQKLILAIAAACIDPTFGMVTPSESLREELGLNMINQLKSFVGPTTKALVLNSRLCANILDDDSDDEHAKKKQRKSILCNAVAAGASAAVSVFVETSNVFHVPHFRRANAHCDRPGSLEFIRSWSDVMFARQTRLVREDFFEVLALIHPDLARNEKMARRSSGSYVYPELQLAMTCRLLAGAQYLETIWYNVHVDTVWVYVDRVLRAIKKRVDNIKLPYIYTKADVQAHITAFSKVQRDKHGTVLFEDMIGATDGIVIERVRPSEKELQGKDYRSYLNRKGFFGWVALAIADPFCSFLMFEVNWTGATNDCTAMDQSEAMT